MKKIALPLALLLLAGTPVLAANDPAQAVEDEAPPSLEELEELDRQIETRYPLSSKEYCVDAVTLAQQRKEMTAQEIIKFYGGTPIPNDSAPCKKESTKESSLSDEDTPPTLAELEEMGRIIDEEMPQTSKAVFVPESELEELKKTKTRADIVDHYGAIPVPVKDSTYK